MVTRNRSAESVRDKTSYSGLIAGIFLLLASLAVLTACAPYATKSEPAAFKVIRQGHILQLNEMLTIPPDKAAVFFQYGKVVNPKLIDQWAPSCRLVFHGLSEQERTVKPDRFTILRIAYDQTLVMSKPLMYASRKLGGILGDGDSPIAEEYAIYFYLHAETQAVVSHLICKHWEDPHDGHYLTVNQIRQALGNVIELKM